MPYAVIDTETSGLFDFSKPADGEGQPRLASIGIILANTPDDLSPDRINMYVRPDGWSIDGTEAAQVNGLTDAFLRERGVGVEEVIDLYEGLILSGHIIVAYNAQFDTKVMRAEMRRLGHDDLFERTPNICVMRGAQQLIGRRVKLVDACDFFGITHDNPHDAVGDTEAAYQIMLALHARGALPDPAVKYAKNRPA